MYEPVGRPPRPEQSTLWVNGIDPGFANDWLPLVLTSVSERIDEVRCMEILNYATYDNELVMFDIMGFGRPIDDMPMLLLPGVLTMAWGSVVRQLAAGLGVELDAVEESYERRAGARDLRDRLGHGRGGHGRRAALRGAGHEGRPGGRRARTRHPAARRPGPDWPQPLGQGCYRVVVTGEPNYTLDMQMLGTDGDHNTAGLKATAMRLVNAVPRWWPPDPV